MRGRDEEGSGSGLYLAWRDRPRISNTFRNEKFSSERFPNFMLRF